MKNGSNVISVTSVQMKSEFFRILRKRGFSDIKADKCAEIFTVNSIEGVYSHGVNRFPRFVQYIIDGYVLPDAEPTLVHKTGSLEQWDGNLGPGPLNATFATERAMQIASEQGIGLIALGNTNHWMRGGTYGWMAARKGFVFIGWTNTEANMPAWGATDARLGNNPLVIAVPYKNEAIVLDFAMTQFSYGKMEAYKIDGKQLPYPGGFNSLGELTTDPESILSNRRALPIGYWKGAGLSLLLDILAAILSGGLSTHQVTSRKIEYGVSQVYIAINIDKLHNYQSVEMVVNDIITYLKESDPENESTMIRFPGESVARIRKENIKNGIPVNREIWENIKSF
jgi:3-dehydro-L-gulonate 2-dehydrogenase